MTRISKVGNLVGVQLSRDALSAANLTVGDTVAIIPVQDGLFIRALDEDVEHHPDLAHFQTETSDDFYRRLGE